MQRYLIDLVSYEELVHVASLAARIADSVEAASGRKSAPAQGR